MQYTKQKEDGKGEGKGMKVEDREVTGNEG